MISHSSFTSFYLDNFLSTVINFVVSFSTRTNCLPPCFYLLDCSNEQIIKYGDNFQMLLLGVTPPITLEYRPSAVEANLTSR